MAHLIEQNDTMFSVAETPWHRLGVVLPKAPTIDEALVAAGLNWKVALRKIEMVEDLGKVEIPNRVVIRQDTKAILGVVGGNWTPLQNDEAFNFFNPFIQSGQVTLETAGSLRDNRTVWILGKIAGVEGEVVKNDPITRYVLLSHAHDGTMSVRTGFTDVRVVCNNTLSMSHNSKASSLIRLRHSANIKENLENVRMTMDIANQEFRANLEQLKLLTRKDINAEDIKKFVKVIFFDSSDLEKSTRSATRYVNMVQKIEDLIETGRGSHIKGVKGTVYGLYNAATEYLTHEAGRSDESRLNSMWFGDNAKLNQKILATALEMAVA